MAGLLRVGSLEDAAKARERPRSIARRYPIREKQVCACGDTATRKNTSGTALCESCSKFVNHDGRL